ncbi:hypothetical protein B0H67DRAFT_594736 [Lasiosphaeris hirsuta]|uniref:Uncharacterized protein n=1 Tax=Lasiosphaeris hirsuta TaxID=260670 RepID=A0AA40DJQ3_9PEZI|nr:hypothetical protein B0H67DRAFT_594736 [Lasiosphaeris hirsuta]
MSILTSQSRVILGPLTAMFQPPAPCSVGVGICSTCDAVFYGQKCGPAGPQDDTTCWPPTTRGALRPSSALSGWGFYSPGISCPVGFTSACHATAASSRADWAMQFLMEPGETAVGCCPPGFNCHNQNGQTCIAVVRTITLSTVTCRSGRFEGFDFATIPNSAVPSLNIFAPMIQIAWKASDQTPTSTSSSPPSSSSETPPTPPTSGSPSPNPPAAAASPGPPGLSGAAIAGISVAAAILVLGAVLGAVFVWWKKRRAAAAAAARPGQEHRPVPGDGGPEFTIGELGAYEKPVELTVLSDRYEAPGSVPRRGGASLELAG